MSRRKKNKEPVVDPAFLLACRTTFELFDPKKTGLISHDRVPWMARFLGRTPSNKEIEDILEELPPPPNMPQPPPPGKPKPKNFPTGKCVNFEQFMLVVLREQQYKLSEKDVRDAFQAFDISDKGWIATSLLGALMQEYAELMSFEEVREFLKLADPENKGKIKYEQFVTRMYSSQPIPKKKKEKKPKKEKKKMEEPPPVAAAPAEPEGGGAPGEVLLDEEGNPIEPPPPVDGEQALAEEGGAAPT